jgi:hypothetical protein
MTTPQPYYAPKIANSNRANGESSDFTHYTELRADAS